MATIKTSIQMFNGMTPGLRSITNALNIAISSFENMQRVSTNSIDVSSLQTARVELNRAEVAFNQVEESIRDADRQQRNLNNDISRGAGFASGLKGAFAGIGSVLGIKKVVSISDEFSRSTARLGLMTGSMENIAGLQDQIYQSAQRTRTAYLGNMDAVAKLGLRAGSIFKNSNETIEFTELLNKQFKIAGASQQEIASATLQLTQALGSGVLRGEEFNAVFEAAPNVMQAVADYMDVPIGKMRDLASDGEISASIVKNAMFAAADEINEKFNKIPHTWSDVWVMAVNKVIKISQPLLQVIGVLANNWSIIEPIIIGLATGIGIYTAAIAAHNIALSVTNTLQAIGAANAAIMAGKTLAQAAATTTATGAQVGFNAALLACPITWIILAVIAVIAVFYAVIAVINKVKGTSISATGLIFGTFAWLGAAILNVFIGVANAAIQFLWTRFVEPFIGIIEWILNVANGGFDSFGGAVANLIGQIISWFLSLGKVVTKIIDAIFGTDWTAGLTALQDNVLAWGKNNNAITLEHNPPQMRRIGLKGAFSAGQDFGINLANKVSGVFGNNTMDQVVGNTDDIAGNTEKMANSMEISQEELKYLRDMAEREAINRFTTAEIKVDFKNESTINSNLDIDGVVDKFTEKLREAVDISAEEVHVIV
ncbi:tape measure protein [Anaerotignum propionicum]|uniref:tape measure protein n=1 Tax=Anaerotignum propionicum TaxID=28446 RepID=UPI00210C3F20|nr:tape measure protein [Anaerotignum propionicum]MCQ4935035.1 tape measure protein [Anaerotignum propionicum]